MPRLSGYLTHMRMERVVPYVRGDVLDIGCQTGQLRGRAAERVNRYVGIDVSDQALDQARLAHPDCEFRKLNIDDEALDYDSVFDTIVMSALIEHVFNLKLLGMGLARALRPGGRVVLTTPTPFGNDFVHRLGARLGVFARSAADDHIVIFNRKRLDIFAREVGLQLVEHRFFQLGCNQLAILDKPRNDASPGILPETT